MKILVLNCGSSSLKCQLIDMENEKQIMKGNYERVGQPRSILKITINGVKREIDNPARDYEEAISTILDLLVSDEYKIIKNFNEIGAVGHRIVHGGEIFKESVLITDEVIKGIESCTDLAPLHNPAGLAGIRACKQLLPNTPMVAVFDTSFHQTLDKKVFIYNLPYKYYKEDKIRKYGFHGTSHRYVSDRLSEIVGRKDLKIISCHLGSGASLCAIKDGKSVDTTMGLTPNAGVPMATRCGDIDPSIIPTIMKKYNLTPDMMLNIMNKESGAWGISGVSADFRDIEKIAARGDERANLALDSRSYIIAQYIGKFLMTLGGADYIIFTGGIGEKGIEERERICSYLEWLDVKLDKEANKVKGEEICISTSDSKIGLYVIPTNEELMIAKDTFELVKIK